MPTEKRVFITGGAGFVGASLAGRLVEHNEVFAYGLLHRDALRHTALAEHPNFHFEEGDVLDAGRLGAAVEAARPDVVVHCAAKAGVNTYFREPATTMRVNLLGTFNLVEQLAGRTLDRLVYMSSSEVYGPDRFGAKEDDVTVIGGVDSPRWVYAASKLAGEHFCFGAMREHGLPVTSVRPFNVYGPLQVGESAMVNFVTRALRGQPLIVTRPGNQIRSWCYIDDFLTGFLQVVDSADTLGEAINLGQPTESITIRSLAEEVIRITGSRSQIELIDHPGGERGEVHVRVPNVDKAERLIGFATSVGLDEGIRRTADWWRDTCS